MQYIQLSAISIFALCLVTAIGCDNSNPDQLVGDEDPRGVRFKDFVTTEAIKIDMLAGDKEGVIEELVAALVVAGDLDHEAQDEIINAIRKRENLGSTGIGRGVAVPHTVHPSVNRLIGTIGVSSQGIDFDSLDGQKTDLFVVLISPPDQPGDQLRALETIARHFRDDGFCRSLRQCEAVEDILQLLEEADEKSFGS